MPGIVKINPTVDTTHPNGTLFPIGGNGTFLRSTFATAFPVAALNIVNDAPVASAALHCLADRPFDWNYKILLLQRYSQSS